MSDRVDGAFVMDNLAAAGWFADAEKVLRYVNRKGEEKGMDENLSANIEECHSPKSVEKIDKLYSLWEKGEGGIKVYRREEVEEGFSYNILVPVYDDGSFEGVLELSFTADG